MELYSVFVKIMCISSCTV